MRRRRAAAARAAALAAGTAWGAAAAPQAPPAAATDTAAHAAPPDPTLGVHGMLVAGDDGGRVLLSHLPLYRAPHDRQVLLVARLAGATPGDRPAAVYAASRRASPERVYTIEPERFPLARLADVRPGAPARFRATLYRGHFERGGTPIARDVVVEVERVLTFRPIAGAAGPEPPAGFVVPLGRETFFVHRVAGAPDYDQVVTLAVAGGPVVPAGAGAWPVRVLAPGAPRPVREGERVRLATEPGAPPRRLTATVAREVYLEFDDLAAGTARHPAAPARTP